MLNKNLTVKNQTKILLVLILFLSCQQFFAQVSSISQATGTWNSIIKQDNFDPNDDQQAVSDTDLVGDAVNAMLEAQNINYIFSTGTAQDDVYFFRVRLGDHHSNGKLNTSFYLALDLDNDQVADVFVEANIKASSPFLAFHISDPSKSGLGPSSTGWENSTNNINIERELDSRSSFITAYDSTTDLDSNGETDTWLEFAFTEESIQSFATDVFGFSISGDTTIALYTFTSTSQTANGDIGGVDDNNDDLSLTWGDLGVIINGSLNNISSGIITDSTAPVITSSTTGIDLAENTGAGQTVYTITATDAVGVISYAIAGTDASDLTVNSSTGVVSLNADPDYETKNSYSFTVTASDAASNTSDSTTVTFSITDLDDTAPVITSSTTGIDLAENTGAGQTVYTITATDAVGVISYAIAGTDASDLTVNSSTGVVSLNADPDYETKNSYSFTVTASDAASNTSDSTTVTFSITDLDDTAPVITSSTTGIDLAENTGAGQTVYTITATDAVGVISYAIAGTDASDLTVNSSTGVVSLNADPDYETKNSYSFTVTASDAASNTSDSTTVTFSITDLDDTAPVITSSTTGIDLAENTGAGQTVYTITATDAVGVISYAIAGTDASDLTVNSSTGVVSLNADPDYETKNSYSFTVTASDAASNTSDSTTVTFSITDLDDTAPVITSSTTGIDLAENTGAGQTVYTITATDAVGVISYAIAGTDASDLTVNSSTGVVSLNADPDYETKNSYSFTVTASDAASNTSDSTTVTFSITDLDDTAPVITSSTTGIDLAENTGAGQTVYTITATDAVGVISYAIAGTDASDLTVNSSTGVVSLNADPDYETKNSYSFTVTASDAASNTSDPTTVTFSITDIVDSTAPVITSSTTGIDLAENTGAGQTVYTITATDAVGVISYAIAGTDASDLTVNSSTGVVSLNADPDYETKNSYSFTVTASDAASNTSDPTTVTFSITDLDDTSPVITLLGTSTVTHEQGTTYTDAGATATDSVDGDLTSSISIVNPVDVITSGEYTITYNVIDAAGNTATQVTRVVTVVDSTSPVITLLGTSTVTHEQGTTYTDAGATATDSVDGDLTSSISIVNPVDVSTSGEYTITYNVIDAAGNTATQVTRVVTVVDSTSPVITLLGTSTVTHEQGTTYTDAGATATDSVDGDLTSSISIVNPVDVITSGEYTITYNVIDAAGNTATQVTRVVTVVDSTSPVITLLGTSTVTHEQGTTYTDAGATATDSVDGDLTSSISIVNPVDVSTSGEYTITYNVIDAAGNTATQVTRVVTVVDSTSPVITLLGTSTVTHEQGTTYTDAGATATDSVDGDLTSSISIVNPVDVSTSGEYTITYNVIDAAGNTATQVTRVVTVVKVNVSSTNIASVSDQTYTGSVFTPLPEVSYNSMILILDTDYTISYLDNTNVGIATITYTGIGNYTGTKTSTFSIIKATPIIVFSDVIKTFGDVDFTIMATSNSSGVFTYSIADNDIATVSLDQVTIIGIGSSSVNASQAADMNYNAATKIMTLTINDIDTDGDGIGNNTDTDDDNDGTLDTDDDFPLDSTEDTDTDGDGIGNNTDTDDDNDGTLDTDDDFPLDSTEDTDTDGDGIGNNTDTDDDNDGTLDTDDDFPLDSTEDTDTDGDGIGNNTDTDDDNDGTLDTDDDFPLDSTEDTDTDGDSIGNNTDTDDDGDGTLDTDDDFPLDSTEDTDTDGDSIGNNTDTDDDNDGTLDTDDDFPLDSTEDTDTDGDGIGNNTDTDDDNDGTLDTDDDFPLDSTEDTDTDGDGIGNNTDTDDDNDGTLDTDDDFPLDSTEDTDTDGDGIGNNTDTDDDGDGFSDADEIICGTALLDITETPEDTDLDGIPDCIDTDDDGDGYTDNQEVLCGSDPLDFFSIPLDNDFDFLPDCVDDDDDNDGILDTQDNCPMIFNPFQEDRDYDGLGDVCDLEEVNISEAFTPNGDGINDTWMIYNIENHPNNTVRVYNRWGREVFYKKRYQNDWDGSYQGNRPVILPEAASYYYQLDLNGDGSVDYKGWIYITK